MVSQGSGGKSMTGNLCCSFFLSYRADSEPAAASGRRVLGVTSGLGTIYTQFNSGVMEPLFVEKCLFSYVHADMVDLTYVAPSALLVTKKA